MYVLHRLLPVLLTTALACAPSAPRGPAGAAAAVDASVDGADGAPSVDVAEPATALDAMPSAPPPAIVALSPDQGPTGGLTTVTISGQGLTGATEVLFGESPGLHLQVLDDVTLAVDAPPRPPGIVAVTVRVPDKPEAVLAAAYRFVAQVTVSSVAPSFGPAAGGTLLTINGTGFAPGTAFVVGDRLGIDPLLLDEHTAVVRTPPGQAGTVAVVASNADGSGTLKHAFTFHEAPRIDRVEPGLGPLAGGNTVQLVGVGLTAGGAAVQLVAGGLQTPAKVVSGAPDGSALTIQVGPTGQPGARDVRYIGVGGDAIAHGAYHYADQPADKLAVLGIAPAALPANDLRAVVVSVAGAIDAADLAAAQVRFDGVEAKILSSTAFASAVGASWTVLPPAGEPHAADVTVALDKASGTGAKVFTYLAPIPKILKVAPEILQAQGGSAVTVSYGPTVPSWGAVTSVRIGALAAGQLQMMATQQVGQGMVVAVAPKGAPGPADVELHFAGGQTLSGLSMAQFAGQYQDVAAIIPATGSQAGGTFVRIIGSNLDQLDNLQLGGKLVAKLEVVHGGLAQMRTPPGEPGPALLRAKFANGHVQLRSAAFTYFNPRASDGGTWGGPIDGAVNVTVTTKGTGKPVVGALVTLGDDAKTPYQGLTDERGQVTLSGKGLIGPVNVHATKQGYSAGSVVAVAVENVTIRLSAIAPAASGNGQPPPVDDVEPLPDGTIEGTVLDAEKYTQLPAGSCAGHAIATGNCAPCLSNADCGQGTTCESWSGPTTSGASYCAAACLASADCPAGFECRGLGDNLLDVAKFRCLPRIGAAQVRCESSSPSIFGSNGAPGPGGIVGSDHTFSISSSPGDSAVVCWSGYVNADGVFTKLVMGLTRRLSIFPGDKVTGVKVSVHVPLTRRVRVRMVAIPMGADATGQRSLTAGLDLGAEGYIPIASQTTMTVTDVMELEHQPAASLFTGDNADVRYEFYGGVANAYGGAPNSTAIGTRMDVTALGSVALWSAGEAMPQPGEALGAALHATDSRPGLAVAVGDAGRIAAWTGGNFTLQPSPTGRDLFAVWLPPESQDDGWIGGEDGTLLRRSALGWQLWSQTAAARVVSLSGRNAADAWLLDAQGQLAHWNGKAWSPFAGPFGKPPTGPQWSNQPLYKYLRALWQAPGGNLYLVGDGGTFLRAQMSGGGPTFTTLTTFTNRNIRGIWGRSDGDIWLCGDRGWLGHWDGNVLTTWTTGVDHPLYSVRGFGKDFPVFAIGGQGTWLRVNGPAQIKNGSLTNFNVDLRGVLPTLDGGAVAVGEPLVLLGPYLEMPYATEPAVGAALGKQVVWIHAPGVTPTLNIVRIADQSYTTRWEMFVRGNVDAVKLPDFVAMGSANPVPPGQIYVRIWRILSPGLEVDHFGSKQLNMYSWTSWAYNVMTTTLPDLPVGAAAGWQIEPKAAPGNLPGAFQHWDKPPK